MLTNQNGSEKKTERIECIAMVHNTGHACIGNMGSESPFIVFELSQNKTLLWHSDNVEVFAEKFGFPSLHEMRGRWVKITANVRPAKRQLNDGKERLQVQRMINLEDQ